jgi:hypothetical protein
MKIESLLMLIACNAASRASAVDRRTGQPAIIWRGNGATMRCAAFVGDPGLAASLVTDWSDVVSATLVVRSGSATGTVLVNKTVLVANFNTALTFQNWLDGQGHFDFVLTGADTNQTMGDGGKLDIYFAIDLQTTDPDPITIAVGTGEIREDGIGNAGTPSAADYEAWSKLESDARFVQQADINDTVIGTDQLGAASGVATLDSGGKVPTGQLPDSVLGQVEYRGSWNANTNTPNLATLNPAARKGDYFVVSVAGASDPDTAGRTWEPGDWLVYNGITWDKIDNTEPMATDTLPGLIKKATAAQTNAQALDDTAVTPRNLRSQTTAHLAANLVITAASDTRQILAPQTTNRDVTLPVINAAPTGDQVGYGHCYSIIHDGSVNSLMVKNSAAVDQVRIDPGESAWLCATSSGWLAVKTFRAGVVSIIFPGIDLTAAAGNTTLYTPVAGMQFLATSALVRNDTVSGTISTAAALQIDNGTDGNDIFASATLSSPATGRFFNLTAATQPRIVTDTAPLRLRRTVAAAGTTPVHVGTIIVNGVLI